MSFNRGISTSNTEYNFADPRTAWMETSTHLLSEMRSNGDDGVKVFTKGCCEENWFSLEDLGCLHAPIERAFLLALIWVTDPALRNRTDPSDIVGQQLRAEQ